MKAKTLIQVVFVAIVWTACSKDKFNTKPTLTFNSVNGNEFQGNDIINFKLTVTDKEGDLQDTIFMQRVTTICPDLDVPIPYGMPPNSVAKANLKAEVDLDFIYKNNDPTGTYKTLTGCSERDDTAYFKFWIKDVAGHVSDTTQSPAIVLLQ